jgi:hypothetical protein
MPNESRTATTERVRLAIPELAARPLLGAGCCVVAAADIIGDALDRAPGVRAVACDDQLGVIDLELDADSDETVLPTVRAILDGLGYPVAQISA